MSECQSCLPLELQYCIEVTGAHNTKVLEQIVPYLHSRNVLVSSSAADLTIHESGMADFIDFSQDHMEQGAIRCRLTTDKEWRSLSDIQPLLDASWVDAIIREGRVVPYCQPIMDAQGELYAHEILSRFKRQDGTLASPLEVFSAAKSRGRLYALDRLCRMTAVRSAAKLPSKVFINFIPTSIYSPEHCLRSTVGLASELGIEPSRFVFEVVETEYVEDIDHLKRILTYYRERGFRYALDDVGEGFSTVEMLQQIEPHYMKLDMGYVRGVAASAAKQEVALKLLRAAQQIGATPLAEGVEAPEDYAWLREAGFQLFQGYMFGKPAPVEG
ncbi:EAL domain-containing protein (putative c-di-GMP-specific phosphodiesterase class I) [Paenibacillus phyllosphaerae]|uniref:EAL domain-containing protein (Putative c-di-GMP-specific phosphodiesterase class I) n=1 Tax=Paenibacillus phyllosphaerae TaxID=274593 RepID=A0A7W5AXR5_9BACL|nr:EAL domain-containing protein [Paenibacillus phyllosphaerae]MBB3110718.1 EAL domain-containing protein (putative c-di-GMP-specific phosphodiesterase class I) [Paenibacillus phyllosphaerae]